MERFAGRRLRGCNLGFRLLQACRQLLGRIRYAGEFLSWHGFTIRLILGGRGVEEEGGKGYREKEGVAFRWL